MGHVYMEFCWSVLSLYHYPGTPDNAAALQHLPVLFMGLNLALSSLVHLVSYFGCSFPIKIYASNSMILACKFLMLIALLVFVRGGIPRYRYDFLTKIGWIKFLSLVLFVFLASISLTYLY